MQTEADKSRKLAVSLKGAKIRENPTDRRLYKECPNCQTDCIDAALSTQLT